MSTCRTHYTRLKLIIYTTVTVFLTYCCCTGFKLVEKCHGHGQRSNCTHCPDGQYLDQMNYSPNCWKCKRCRGRQSNVTTMPVCVVLVNGVFFLPLFTENEVEKTKCTRDTNTVCRCNDGFYRSYIDSVTYECIKCTACQANEKKIQNCKTNSTAFSSVHVFYPAF